MPEPRFEARLSAALTVYARADLSMIDRYARRQKSALGARLFPSLPGRSCSCGCGRPLPPRRKRWASGECVQAASDVIRIVTGDAGLIRMFLHWRDGCRLHSRSQGAPRQPPEALVLGVVVGGPGRGEAFRVCVARKKCKVHWAAEMKQAEQRANGTGNGQAAPRVDHEAPNRKWEEQERKAAEERARWKKAAPQLLRVLVEKLNATPPMDLVDLILAQCRPYGFSPDTYMQRGDTVEEAVRYAAFLVLSQAVTNEWGAPTKAAAALKPFGIDARKIVDQAAPKPKKPKKEAPAKAKEDAPAEPKKGARARRREKSLQPSAEAGGQDA